MWQATEPTLAQALNDARLQLHHAAQFAAALGISYLPRAADDSHTNLGFDAAHGALVSRTATGTRGPVSVGVRVQDLALFVRRGEHDLTTIPLHAFSITDVERAVREALAAAGLDSARYTLRRHYELPSHAVATGAAFDASNIPALAELARWYGNASLALQRIAETVTGASEVRTWPHHFDNASLVTLGGGRSTGVGMEPGDEFYAEPYFYVNVYPRPRAAQLGDVLAGGGVWHTNGWIGAVLTGSRITGDAAAQRTQVDAFLDSALAACRGLAGV
jgi:hypothetical protein